jgi:hypothetical protein
VAQGLIELIEYPYKQGASSFLEAYLERTSKLSMLGLEQFGMGDRPGSFSWVRMTEDKVRTKDSCWSVGTIYDTREPKCAWLGAIWVGDRPGSFPGCA